MLDPFPIGISTGLGAAGLGLAAGGYAYAAMWPGSRIFGRALTAPRHTGELALTFDDGPNPVYTPRFLDLLARHGAKATFFMLGLHAQAEPQLVRRIAQEGHLVANHSWSHPNLARSGRRRITDELTWTRDTLEQITGSTSLYFRPPYGARRPLVFRTARSLGMTTVMWNAMTSDWSEQSPERIARALIAKIDQLLRRGYAANIVLHDASHLDRGAYREPSLAALELLLERYGQTHRFVTVDAWESQLIRPAQPEEPPAPR